MEKFTDEEIEKCYLFAKAMKGKHNPDMIMSRTDGEIFRDDFRGKLGEIAFRNYIQNHFPEAKIQSDVDYEVTERGKWDITDLKINDVCINVKSVKENARFLLVETKRYKEDGTYKYKNSDGSDVKVDGYVLVRVKVKPEVGARELNGVACEQFMSRVKAGAVVIEAEVLGGIRHQDFWAKKQEAKKGMPCKIAYLEKAAKGIHDFEEPQQKYNKKTDYLQTDNYIFDSTQLGGIEQIAGLIQEK